MPAQPVDPTLEYVAGWRSREIAEALGLSERSVEAELKRARDVIRSRAGHATWSLLATLGSVSDPASGNPPARLVPDLLRIVDAGTALRPAATGGIAIVKTKELMALGITVLLLLAGAGVLYWLLPSPTENHPINSQSRLEPNAAKRGMVRAPRENVSAEEHLPPPVDLGTADRDRDLFGIVVDRDGQPVPEATVNAQLTDDITAGPKLYPQDLRTDTDGRVLLKELFPEPTQLWIIVLPDSLTGRDLRTPDPITITPKGQTVVLTLESPPR